MKLLGTQKTLYALSQGICPPKEAIVALNKEGAASWKRLLEDIKTPDLLTELRAS